MSYNPATDFLGLYRTVSGGVAKESMPGLDFFMSAFGRAGLISVSASGVAPVVNQSTTAWFQPASPSYSAEGALSLWNGTAYVAATAQHFTELLLNSFSTTRGAIAFRGVNTWQALAPGTVGYLLTSGGAGADPTWSTIGAIGGALDGITNTVGALPYRGAGGWVGTGAGAQWTVLNNSVANTPAWTSLSALIDGAIGSTRGALLERGAAGWALVVPGVVGSLFTSGGAGADPAWGTPGQILGTATSSSAAAGNIGEYIENIITVPQNFAATTVYSDLTSIALTAGDWDVSLLVNALNNGATCQQVGAGIGTAAGSATTGLVAGVNELFQTGTTAASNASVAVPAYRVSLAAPATIYGKVVANYSAGGPPQYTGRLSARRVR